MSIIDKNSVFIVGAGTSAIFGMPLGSNLIEDIAEQIKVEIKRTITYNSSGQKTGSFDIDIHALKEAVYGNKRYEQYSLASAEYKRVFPGRQNTTDYKVISIITENLRQLMVLLSNQTSDTIDDFIVENEAVSELTKIAISTTFIKQLYELNNETNKFTLKNLSKRKFEIGRDDKGQPHFERNWIHHFINLVRKAVQVGEVSPENKVKVISFNYDNILEHVLHEQFQNTGYDYDTWDKYIEIVHPHGQCGLLQKTIENPAETAIEWAKGIFVVNEKEGGISEHVKLGRNKAKQWIKSAEKIYSLGFAFSGPNLRLLGLEPDNTRYFARLISYCNYDGNVGLKRSLSRFERIDVTIEPAEGERNAPMTCSDWFTLGYAGELPS